MIPNKLLDTRLVSILCFRVFIDIQSRRPLDSFLGVNPFPCTRFRNSFACHTSENSPVSPAIATDPKTPPNNPCICHTSETPPGSFPSFDSARLPSLPCPCGQRELPTLHRLWPNPLSPAPHSAYPLFFHILAHSFALTKNSTPLFSIVSALFAKTTRGVWGWEALRTGGRISRGCQRRTMPRRIPRATASVRLPAPSLTRIEAT